jgi:hypothetical protein
VALAVLYAPLPLSATSCLPELPAFPERRGVQSLAKKYEIAMLLRFVRGLLDGVGHNSGIRSQTLNPLWYFREKIINFKMLRGKTPQIGGFCPLPMRSGVKI